MNKTLLGTVGLLLAAVLFVALNAVGGSVLKSARLDLTEAGLYTLSDGTRNILRGIEEPITLRFWYSRGLTDQVPEITSYGQRVQELLEEYALVADGGIALSVIDPTPFSEEEDEAVSAGVQGIPLPTGDMFYFGLSGSSATDETSNIPFFDPSQEAMLEYELSRFVHRLGHSIGAKVGVLSALPVQGSPAQPFPGAPPGVDPWYVLELARESFELEFLPRSIERVPDDVNVLLLIHPKDLDDGTLYAIDQFVLGGGRALVLVDPHSEEDRPPTDPGNPLAGMGTPRASNLAPLLAAWGVHYDPEVFVGDRTSALYVSGGSQGRPERTPYVAWVELSGDCLDDDDPVTSGVGALRLATAGELSPLEGAATTFTPLLRTTEDAAVLEVSTIQFFPQPKELLAGFVSDGLRHVLAARVTGPTQTAFPDGPPDLLGAEDGDFALPEGHRAVSEGPIHVIVVADADLAADGWWVQFQNFFGTRVPVPSAANADFLLNALDSLSGSTDLVSVRGRGRSDRPFLLIEELRREAEQRFLAEEQRLQEQLRSAEQRINELQNQREETASLILTPEQQLEIERFQAERVSTRKKLRAVKHELSKDIEGLKDSLMFANTLGVPLLLLLVALGSWFSRKR